MTIYPKVFISHSHHDRHFATQLQAVLKTNGAETYLDQDNIQAGDILPNRIDEGINWSNNFLLLWSSSAAMSGWVDKEWNTAYNLRKKIIPYLLDITSLPHELENMVYASTDDHEHGDAALLMAVFGKSFLPDPTTIFPGKWHATQEVFGLAGLSYDLTIRENGQIDGIQRAELKGNAGEIARSVGLPGLFENIRVSVKGSWTFNKVTQILTLNLTTIGYGQSNTDIITIYTNGRERGAIQGQDQSSCPWSFQRVN